MVTKAESTFAIARCGGGEDFYLASDVEDVAQRCETSEPSRNPSTKVRSTFHQPEGEWRDQKAFSQVSAIPPRVRSPYQLRTGLRSWARNRLR